MATQTIETDLDGPTAGPTDGGTDSSAATNLLARFEAARQAQDSWSTTRLKDRLRMVRSFRHQLVQRADQMVASVTYPPRNGPAETLAGELIPLADACKFLEKEAKRILAPRRLSRRSRPLWLGGVSVELRRDPFGILLIVGASNYPLLLPGVQTLQALVAGNAVFIKPGTGSTAAAQALVDTFVAAGLDLALVHVLPEDPRCVAAAVEAGADKVVLTGSAETGRRVQSLLAQSLTPATMELSGCDSVFVLDSADVDRVAGCLAFGLRFNSSATCIAPRRVFVPLTMQAQLEERLRDKFSRTDTQPTPTYPERTIQLVAEAIRDGATTITGGVAEHNGSESLAGTTVLSDTKPEMTLLRSDVFAPVMSLVPVASMEDALRADRQCPYALGASVFGAEPDARRLAQQIDAGCVVINDLIAPTADPRVPFGGRRQSGFGMTRGAAGLEEMTQLKVIVNRRSRWLPHLDEPTPYDASLLTAFLEVSHGRNWRGRLRSAWTIVRAVMDQRKWKKQKRTEGRLSDVE